MEIGERIEELKQKIADAFTDAPYPKSIIAPHECEECREIRRIFANKDWKNINPEILKENYGIIPLFSPAAFHFFIPAYLIYSLESISEKYLNEVFEFTVYALTPDKEIKEKASWWRERFKDFTLDQLKSVYEFLDLAEEIEDFSHISIGRRKERLKTFVEPDLKL